MRRKTKQRKDGRYYVNVTYPKFKMGEEVVREVAEPPTYGTKITIFSITYLISNTKQIVGNNYF